MAAACGPARGLSVPPPHWGSEASTANVRPRRGQQEQWTPRAQVTMPAPLLWASARDRGQPSCVVRDSLSPLKTPGVTQLLSPVPTPRVWPSRPQEPTQYQESQRAPDVDSLSDGRELADGRPSAQCTEPVSSCPHPLCGAQAALQGPLQPVTPGHSEIVGKQN